MEDQTNSLLSGVEGGASDAGRSERFSVLVSSAGESGRRGDRRVLRTTDIRPRREALGRNPARFGAGEFIRPCLSNAWRPVGPHVRDLEYELQGERMPGYLARLLANGPEADPHVRKARAQIAADLVRDYKMRTLARDRAERIEANAAARYMAGVVLEPHAPPCEEAVEKPSADPTYSGDLELPMPLPAAPAPVIVLRSRVREEKAEKPKVRASFRQLRGVFLSVFAGSVLPFTAAGLLVYRLHSDTVPQGGDGDGGRLEIFTTNPVSLADIYADAAAELKTFSSSGVSMPADIESTPKVILDVRPASYPALTGRAAEVYDLSDGKISDLACIDAVRLENGNRSTYRVSDAEIAKCQANPARFLSNYDAANFVLLAVMFPECKIGDGDLNYALMHGPGHFGREPGLKTPENCNWQTAVAAAPPVAHADTQVVVDTVDAGVCAEGSGACSVIETHNSSGGAAAAFRDEKDGIGFMRHRNATVFNLFPALTPLPEPL